MTLTEIPHGSSTPIRPNVWIRPDFDTGTFWAAVNHIECRELQLAVAGFSGQLSKATLFWRSGRIRQDEQWQYGDVNLLDLERWYVRIQYLDPETSMLRYWAGVVTNETRELGGLSDSTVAAPPGQTIQHADQTFTALGFEWFFTRYQVTSSFTLAKRFVGTDPPVQDITPWKIPGALPHNYFDKTQTYTQQRKGNRSEADNIVYQSVTAGGANWQATGPAFDSFEDSETVIEWDGAACVRYWIGVHVPLQLGGPLGPIVQIATQELAAMQFLRPVIQTEGRTVYDLINEIITPRRGVTWWLDWEDPFASGFSVPVVRLRLATFTPTAIVLTQSVPGSSQPAVIPANTRQFSLDFRRDRKVLTTHFVDFQPKYEVVWAEGARYGSVFSLATSSEFIDNMWTVQQEDAYLDGMKDLYAGYANADKSSKESMNDAIRVARYSDVWTTWRILPDWAGIVSTLPPDVTPRNYQAFPDLQIPDTNAGGGEPNMAAINAAYMRIESYVPLRENWDYRDPENPQPIGFTSKDSDFMRPFTIYKLPSSANPDDNTPSYQFGHRLSSDDQNELMGVPATDTKPNRGTAGIQASVYVEPLDNAFGFRLVTQPMPHSAAIPPEEWESSSEPSKVAPQVAYNARAGQTPDELNRQYITVYAQATARVRESYPVITFWDPFLAYAAGAHVEYNGLYWYAASAIPAAAAPPGTDIRWILLELGGVTQELTIRLGDTAFKDWIVQDTVVGLDYSSYPLQPLLATRGAYLRDDSGLLRDVARVAYLWYGQPRRSVSGTCQYNFSPLYLGSLITTLDGITVNTVVTGITYRFSEGTSSFATQLVRPDFRAFLEDFRLDATAAAQNRFDTTRPGRGTFGL